MPKDHWYKKNMPGGSACRIAYARYYKNWTRVNEEKMKGYRMKYREAHKDKLREYNTDYVRKMRALRKEKQNEDAIWKI